PGVVVMSGARNEGQARHRGDGGQGLAAKPHRRHGFEFFQCVDLAGGMSRQGKAEFVLWNTAAIVADGDAAYAAAIEPDLDALRARIEGVFEDLFQHRRRALDDLAGGDLADEKVRERGNGAAWRHGTELLQWHRAHPSSAPPARQAP